MEQQEQQRQQLQEQPTEQLCAKVFIYGMLRSDLGEGVRSICHNWLHYEPKVTNDAAVLGKLFYYRYPGLLLEDVIPTTHCDLVKGQLLEFQPEQMKQVLERLDGVEGCYAGYPYNSLYHRRLATIWVKSEEHGAVFDKAWVYVLALNPIGNDWKEFTRQHREYGSR